MSVRVISWVWEQSLAEGTDRLVLLAIADCAGDDGGNAWPSISTLADKARVSARTVQRAVKALQLLGELEVDANAGRHGTNMYSIRMDRQIVTPSISHPDNLTPVTKSPRQIGTPSTSRGGVTTVTPGGDTVVTRTVLEPPLTVQPELRSGSRTRGTRLPADWRPNDTDRAWTLERIDSAAAALELEKFRNHWTAKSGRDATKLDWGATWRNWVLNGRRPSTSARPTGGSADHIARAAARLGAAK